MNNTVSTILFIAFLTGPLFADSQSLGTNKRKRSSSASRYSLSITTYNHAGLLFDGMMVYELKGKKLTISNQHTILVHDKKILASTEIEDDLIEQIKAIKLDTLSDYYSNHCVMITSGDEYFFRITNGKNTKNIRLHHYYHPQVEKLVALINKLVPEKYQIDYETSDTKQDCE
jgi:hypothetical protein